MRPDAEKDGAKWASKNDDRVPLFAAWFVTRKGEAMASFVKTGEHYFKSLNVLKEKSDNFVRTIEMVRNYMASVIQRLPQNQSCFNILSVGSGTGEMDMEILKIAKEELQRTQGRDQIKIYNRAIEPNEYACDLYKSAVKSLKNLGSNLQN